MYFGHLVTTLHLLHTISFQLVLELLEPCRQHITISKVHMHNSAADTDVLDSMKHSAL